MGLDDFTEESLSDDEEQRKAELSQNSPPGDDTEWHTFEPGTPDWLSFISGNEKENDNLPSLDRGVDEIEEDEVLVVNIEGVTSTTLRAGNYVRLGDWM